MVSITMAHTYIFRSCPRKFPPGEVLLRADAVSHSAEINAGGRDEANRCSY